LTLRKEGKVELSVDA